MSQEERKDVFEDVTFSLAKKEKEQEEMQRERNSLYLAKILSRMTSINHHTSWIEVGQGLELCRTHMKLLRLRPPL